MRKVTIFSTTDLFLFFLPLKATFEGTVYPFLFHRHLPASTVFNFPSTTSRAEEGERMVLNSAVVVSVANVSANVCQYISCNPEPFSSGQVLHLLFCYSFRNVRPVLVALWSCLCFPPLDSDSDSDFDD